MNEYEIISDGFKIKGVYFEPSGSGSFPAVLFCHGYLEHKEVYYDFAKKLTNEGFITSVIDMRGHGESEGERFVIKIDEWTTDAINAINYLESLPNVKKGCFGLVGLSSGGTICVTAAAKDDRIKAIVSLDGTVKSSLPFSEKVLFRVLGTIGKVKKIITKKELRINTLSMMDKTKIAVDPEVDKSIKTDPLLIEGAKSLPFPGCADSFFVDLKKELKSIKQPTLIIHGTQDELDPPSSAEYFYKSIVNVTEKDLQIIEGSGHQCVLDQKRELVFDLLSSWFKKYL